MYIIELICTKNMSIFGNTSKSKKMYPYPNFFSVDKKAGVRITCTLLRGKIVMFVSF